MGYVALIVLIAECVFMSFVFEKMGIENWKGFIPGYNFWILFREIEGNGHRVFLTLIPVYGLFWILLPMFKKFAARFGKSEGWGWGLTFAAPVFLALIAFNKNVKYQ